MQDESQGKIHSDGLPLLGKCTLHINEGKEIRKQERFRHATRQGNLIHATLRRMPTPDTVEAC